MNKFVIASITVLILILISGIIYVKKQWFDDGSLLTTPTISADKVTRLSAAGGDMRLYEFTPQTAPHMQCIFIVGTNKGSTFCFPKRGYDAKIEKTN